MRISTLQLLRAHFLAAGLVTGVFAAEFYVAPDGRDAADGTLAHPFATLERARAAVRSARDFSGKLPEGGVTVFLRGGQYFQDRTFALESSDSGEAPRPVIYRSYPGESVRLMGSRPLQAKWFSAVDRNSPMWDRLAPEARGHLLEVSLPAHGITNYGTLLPRGMYQSRPAALELFVGDAPMPLAQWPDADEAPIHCLGCGFASITRVLSPISFEVPGERIARWTRAKDAWFHGYWGNMWSDFHLPAGSFDVETRTVTLAAAPRFKIKAGQPFRIYNLIEEITQPGEWYLDRSDGHLYVWPPANWEKAGVFVSVLDQDLIRLDHTSHVTIEGMTLAMTRARLIEVIGGDHNLVRDCMLRDAGTDAAAISGHANGLSGCEITDCGESGVQLSGGSREKLAAGENFVRDCRFARFSRWVWTYTPAIKVSGVGQIVANNLIADAPHAAIIFGGNNHLIELNEIHDVCLFTNDAGAIYGGRQWAYRGNEIRYNFIHDLHNPFGDEAHGVYLDDCLSGVRVFGNVFYKVSGWAVVCAGGRDNIIENNVMARCGAALSFDARGVKWIRNQPGSDWNLPERLAESGSDWNLPGPAAAGKVRYREEPWSGAYPALAAMPNDWATLTAPGSLWFYPEGCSFSRNVGFANQAFIKWLDFMGGNPAIYHALLRAQDNLANQDPHFADEASLDLALRADSPAFALPGFERIPFEKIGPHQRSTANSTN